MKKNSRDFDQCKVGTVVCGTMLENLGFSLWASLRYMGVRRGPRHRLDTKGSALNLGTYTVRGQSELIDLWYCDPQVVGKGYGLEAILQAWDREGSR